MTKLASAAGVNRENLYRMLSGRGNPRLNNFKAVMDAIGLAILFAPVGRSSSAPPAQDVINRNATDVPQSRICRPLIRGTQSNPVGFFNTGTGFITISNWHFGQQGRTQIGMPILNESGPVGETSGKAPNILPVPLTQNPSSASAFLQHLK
jgi:hypothetical protein